MIISIFYNFYKIVERGIQILKSFATAFLRLVLPSYCLETQLGAILKEKK